MGQCVNWWQHPVGEGDKHLRLMGFLPQLQERALGSAEGAKRLSMLILSVLRYVEYERIFPKQTNKPILLIITLWTQLLKKCLFENRYLTHGKTNDVEVRRGTHCLVVADSLFQIRTVATGRTDILWSGTEMLHQLSFHVEPQWPLSIMTEIRVKVWHFRLNLKTWKDWDEASLNSLQR